MPAHAALVVDACPNAALRSEPILSPLDGGNTGSCHVPVWPDRTAPACRRVWLLGRTCRIAHVLSNAACGRRAVQRAKLALDHPHVRLECSGSTRQVTVREIDISKNIERVNCQ